MPKSSKEQIDLDEKKVIEELEKNAKNSFDNIAKNCDYSRQKVRRIIKKLENDKTIWGYVPIFDDDKRGLKHFTVLFKRNSAPLNKNTISNVTKGDITDNFPEGNIRVENVLFVHGEYDWIISFSAPDVSMMKKFCDKLMITYGDFIDRYSVHETIIPIRKQGIKNPVAEKLGEYF